MNKVIENMGNRSEVELETRTPISSLYPNDNQTATTSNTTEHHEQDKGFQLASHSPFFLTAVNVAKRAAKSYASILITGESGCGKEIFAHFIHDNSKCNHGPFVALNCSSIPENLLESELFGHAKGSFTGALEKRVGLFESAENGTLFLDEIGDLALSLQAKILRVLQEKSIKRVGENVYRPVNCRIISATHKNLIIEVKEARFREDLFFRLNVIPINIPPLRDRPEDIIPLSEYFLNKFTHNNTCKSFSKSAIDSLLTNKWRGNVRELENTIERAVVLCDSLEIKDTDLNSPVSDAASTNEDADLRKTDENKFCISHLGKLPNLEDVINTYITYAIKRNGGAKDRTAKEIGIDRKTLYKRMSAETANGLD